MGFVLKTAIAACLVFGFHYAIKHGVATAVTSQLGDNPTPPTITVDPAALRQAQEVTRAFDNTAARAVVEGAEARMREMNRTMPVAPPNIAGMPHR